MGTVKALLPLGRGSMVQTLVSTLMTVKVDPILIVTGYAAEEIEKELTEVDAQFVHNARYADTDMLDSIRLGIRSLQGRCNRILLWPVDTPLVQADTVQKILNADGVFVCPSFHRRSGHPVLLDESAFDHVMRYSGQAGLKGAVQTSGIQPSYVVVEDEGVLLNGNTPEEYAKMLSRVEQPKN